MSEERERVSFFEKGAVETESKRFFVEIMGGDQKIWLGNVIYCLSAMERCSPVGKESD